MSKLNNYPTLLLDQYQAVENAGENSSERHKKLLDLSESLLLYISGILFGEYKRSGKINIDIESEFYKHSKKTPTLGIFQGFIRLLIQELDNSLLMDRFDNQVIYESAAQVVFSFDVLKEVLDAGEDNGFKDKTEPLKKGKTPKKIGLMKFFDFFIQIRNIHAHPEEKVGPKNTKRRWPLNDEYFEYINNDLEQALTDIMESLDVLLNYRCAVTEDIFDEKNQARFLIEAGMKKMTLDLPLSKEQMQNMSVEERYLVDATDKIYSRLYYHRIPAVNPQVAKEVIAKEKANQILPHLKQLIHDKLSDDGRIDNLEYMVLWDTARTASLTESQLFELIESIRKQIGIHAETGTPEQKGPLFIDKHEISNRLGFNPFWLKYFQLVSKIDDATQKQERESVSNSFDGRIDKIKKELKNLPGKDRIQKHETKMRQLRGKLKELKSRKNEIPGTYRDKLRSARSEERKEMLNEERSALENRITGQIEKLSHEIDEFKIKIEELQEKQGVKKNELEFILSELQQDREAQWAETTWGIHRDLWKELEQYIAGLLDTNLNNVESTQDEDDGVTEKLWINRPNQWQMGKLTLGYWAKVYQSNAPFDDLFHIGFLLGNRFKWVPKNIPEKTLKDRINQPCVILWASLNDDRVQKVDAESVIKKKYYELCQELVNNYSEQLMNLHINVTCTQKEVYDESGGDDHSDLFVSLEYYMRELKHTHKIKRLYSNVYILSDFYDNSVVNLSSVHQFEEEVQALFSLFSNVVAELNDYAVEMGVDRDYIKRKEEQFIRYQKLMHEKFSTALTSGGFRPVKEQVEQWKEYAKQELGVSDYLFDMMLASYRWGK